MSESVIINEISFRYTSRPVFENFSAIIPANSLIIGDNGSGKTTLLKLIAKIFTPEKGSIILNNSFDYYSSTLFNNKILFDSISIKQHIIWIIKTFHISNSFLNTYNSEFMEKSFIERKPSELSEGERQWAAIMLTCLMPADIYLLDEPMRALDETHCKLLNVFIQKQIETGKHFIISAHHDKYYPKILSPFILTHTIHP